MQTSTSSNAANNLEQAYNLSGGESALQCKVCGRTGYPLMPLRNCYVSGAAPNSPSPETAIKSSVELLRRTVRIMREGYLYVYIYNGKSGQAKRLVNILAYEVTPEGFFRQYGASNRRDAAPDCIPAKCEFAGHGAQASFISIDEAYVDGNHTAYFAFAQNSWSTSVVRRYETELAKPQVPLGILSRFKEINLAELFNNSQKLKFTTFVDSYMQSLAEGASLPSSFFLTTTNYKELSKAVCEYDPFRDYRDTTPTAHPFSPKGGDRNYLSNIGSFLQLAIPKIQKPASRSLF